jgi:hypothetical protein
VTDAFVYTVEFLRDRRILAGIIDRDIALTEPTCVTTPGLLGVSVSTFAGYLVDRGGYDATSATVIAETLTRLVARRCWRRSPSSTCTTRHAADLREPGRPGRRPRVLTRTWALRNRSR